MATTVDTSNPQIVSVIAQTKGLFMGLFASDWTNLEAQAVAFATQTGERLAALVAGRISGNVSADVFSNSIKAQEAIFISDLETLGVIAVSDIKQAASIAAQWLTGLVNTVEGLLLN